MASHLDLESIVFTSRVGWSRDAKSLVFTPLVSSIVSPHSAALGRCQESGQIITLADEQRCGGLYILGQPRTGKSNLLMNLTLSDIENGRGLLFIDPHADAINDLMARIPDRRLKEVILLDPTETTRSFGINLLYCPDITDPLQLDKTCGRVRDVFAKVWGDDRGYLGVWLDKVLRNSVYLLLENPGYTLVDIPILLWEDTIFRNQLLAKVKIKHTVKDFWYNEFDRLTKRDRTEQVGPVLSRLDILRTNDMIKHIVGQTKSTIDFKKILSGEEGQR